MLLKGNTYIGNIPEGTHLFGSNVLLEEQRSLLGQHICIGADDRSMSNEPVCGSSQYA